MSERDKAEWLADPARRFRRRAPGRRAPHRRDSQRRLAHHRARRHGGRGQWPAHLGRGAGRLTIQLAIALARSRRSLPRFGVRSAIRGLLGKTPGSLSFHRHEVSRSDRMEAPQLVPLRQCLLERGRPCAKTRSHAPHDAVVHRRRAPRSRCLPRPGQHRCRARRRVCPEPRRQDRGARGFGESREGARRRAREGDRRRSLSLAIEALLRSRRSTLDTVCRCGGLVVEVRSCDRGRAAFRLRRAFCRPARSSRVRELRYAREANAHGTPRGSPPARAVMAPRREARSRSDDRRGERRDPAGADHASGQGTGRRRDARRRSPHAAAPQEAVGHEMPANSIVAPGGAPAVGAGANEQPAPRRRWSRGRSPTPGRTGEPM